MSTTSPEPADRPDEFGQDVPEVPGQTGQPETDEPQSGDEPQRA